MFAGNSDRNTVVFNRLYPSFHGRYVRFYPKQWHSFIAMRIELYGCNRGKDRKTRLYLMYLLMVKEPNFIPLESLSCSLQESRFSDSMFECVEFAVVSSVERCLTSLWTPGPYLSILHQFPQRQPLFNNTTIPRARH